MAGSVLLIDDDVDVLRSIGNYFERLGYEVTRELSGEAGLATFDRLRPEVVILDLGLPGMDGMEVLEHLRQRDASVILLTGQTDVATAVRAMQLDRRGERIGREAGDAPDLERAIDWRGLARAGIVSLEQILKEDFERRWPGSHAPPSDRRAA